MRPAGFPVHSYELEDFDAEQCAAWLLDLVDESPDRLAIVTMPLHRDDDDLDRLETLFISAYDLAKAERPDLSVKILHAVLVADGRWRDRIAVAVHEHQWIGGACVRGCGQ